ncbi:MAG: hypothetical protein OQJ96_10855 [Flavobacteriales bacterium]|nr:hypothetical protein [Flavobacteriales bacterium]MCW8912922.1 hypothetical protein [Flavobacteriales bacterium]MCW8938724.1 hypothetical protein [Flavobacteriales bacterium]MCW8967941.1 hypothetical protein [Flavobacteriales bacterium]MCW8988923.1 hypothetical protein [Flavobacteriales bacterium]
MKNYKTLGPILFLILLIVDCLLIAFLDEGTMKNVWIAIVSTFLGGTGFSLKDIFTDVQEKREIRKMQNEVVKRFNNFFASKLGYSIKVDNLEGQVVESEILRSGLKDKLGEKTIISKINSLILCYYCKKWDSTKTPGDYQQIKIQAENLSIAYGEITKEVHLFLEDYTKLVIGGDKKQEDNVILKEFTENHYKDLQFFGIREELHQSKNLHETLVRVIQDGKLSTYGINKETLEKLQRDLQSNYMKQNTYMILTNKVPESVSSYIKSLPGFTGNRLWTRNIPDHKSLFGVYIIRPPEVNSIDELIEIIKSKAGKQNTQTLMRIVPLDFLHSKIYTIPEDQSFTSQGLQESYETLEWFRMGYVMEESVIWNEIAKSNISPNELLSLIPFNIFCPGILPVEQSFLIKHYDKIKATFGIEKLGEWRDKNTGLMRDEILKFGEPEYTDEHYVNIMGLLEGATESDKENARKVRILELCEQIKSAAGNFYASMQYQEKI